MTCYRDMTFCSADCTNKGCHRQFTEEDKRKATEWMDNPLIAFCDFSKDCEEYRKC